MVDLIGNSIELRLAVAREVGALGQVLTHQSIGVLVGPTLPRAVRVTEVQRNARAFAQLLVRKRTAIPPCQNDKAVSHLRMRYQVGCQWCGSNSPIWLARCMGRRAITSRR